MTGGERRLQCQSGRDPKIKCTRSKKAILPIKKTPHNIKPTRLKLDRCMDSRWPAGGVGTSARLGHCYRSEWGQATVQFTPIKRVGDGVRRPICGQGERQGLSKRRQYKFAALRLCPGHKLIKYFHRTSASPPLPHVKIRGKTDTRHNRNP